MKKLFVGNIPHSTTETELRTLFEPHGAVEQVSIVTDRDTGRSRGFAFVEMTDSGEAEKAIAALNGKELAAFVASGPVAVVVTTIVAMRVSHANRAGSRRRNQHPKHQQAKGWAGNRVES